MEVAHVEIVGADDVQRLRQGAGFILDGVHQDEVLVHLAFLAHNDCTATVMGTFEHELIWKIVEVNILGTIPYTIAIRQYVLKVKALYVLSHFIFVRILCPL